MHGSFHELSETLDDHYNGLCTELPALIGAPNPITQSGEDWFKAQNANIQSAILGPGKLQAWDDGLFKFSKLTEQRENPVFGSMKFERTLQGLLTRSEGE
jgi:hypothetical protein